MRGIGFAAALAGLALLGAGACGKATPGAPRSGPASATRGAAPSTSGAGSPMRPLANVLRDHTPELLRLPGVVGTAQGEQDGRAVFLILVRRAGAPLVHYPEEIEGYRVRVREVGDVRADSR
jgi:hypothetical protein